MSIRYLKSEFLTDLIPIIPLQIIDLGGNQRFFYLIKIIRLVKGLNVYDVPEIVSKIKFFNNKEIERIIEHEKEKAEDMTLDQTNIGTISLINYFLKIFRLALLLFNTVYFIGFLWLIICDLHLMSKI